MTSLISESLKEELLEKFPKEAMLFSCYCKLYFVDRQEYKFSGIAGVLLLSSEAPARYLRVVDIRKLIVRFEMEVYSNIDRYLQQTGSCLITLPVPHKLGHTLVAFQLQSSVSMDALIEALTVQLAQTAVLLEPEAP